MVARRSERTQTLAPRKADAVAEARHTIDRILSRQEG